MKTQEWDNEMEEIKIQKPKSTKLLEKKIAKTLKPRIGNIMKIEKERENKRLKGKEK